MSTYLGTQFINCDPDAEPTRAHIATPDDAAAAEPNGGDPNTAAFVVSITPDDRPLTHAAEVKFTVGGAAPAATRGTDYTLSVNGAALTGNSVTFPVGPPEPITILLTALSDAVAEGSENVAITLDPTDPEGSQYYLRSLTAITATATIANHAPLTVTATATDAFGREGSETDTIAFTISRNSDTTREMEVSFTLSGATPGSDYQVPGSKVNIPAGASSSPPIVIRTLQDSVREGTESVTMTPVAPGAPHAPHAVVSGTAHIQDDDLPSVSVTSTVASVTEGAGVTAGFVFARDTNAGDLDVQFTVSGTATSASDYEELPTQVSFAAGQSTRTVTVALLQDEALESPETIVVQVSAGADYLVASPTQASVTVIDDDQPTVHVRVDAANARENATDGAGPVLASFNLTRNNVALSSSLTVRFAVTGTATAGADYTQLPTQVTIPAGKAFLKVAVVPVDDTVAEATESVVLTLQSGSYAIGAPSSGEVFIGDDDGLPLGEDGDSVPSSVDNCPEHSNADQLDTDGDGQGDACDGDDDNDGLGDDAERSQGTLTADADSDDDGLSDSAEGAGGTDPLDRFSPDYRARAVQAAPTGNGVRVTWEATPDSRSEAFQVWRQSDPTLLATLPVVPGQVFYSFDDTGFPGGSHTYYVQALLPGQEDAAFDPAVATASPTLDLDLCEARPADSDNDTLCDAREQALGTNLYDVDTDSDGVSDGEEYAAGTDPKSPPADDGGGDGANPFKEPLLWLGAGLLAALVAAVVVGSVFYMRGRT